MGLKGSLRNTSSVLPAFFDVTITNTNSPVQEGDILTVDYSADNTGDAQDTQDIRLEIDSVQEDVDPGVMLGGGASATGTLEWDTTGEPEAEYTATVLSDDDSDSVTVEIESAIPNSVVEDFERDDPLDIYSADSGDMWEVETDNPLEEDQSIFNSAFAGRMMHTDEYTDIVNPGNEIAVLCRSLGDARFRFGFTGPLEDGERGENQITVNFREPEWELTINDDDLGTESISVSHNETYQVSIEWTESDGIIASIYEWDDDNFERGEQVGNSLSTDENPNDTSGEIGFMDDGDGDDGVIADYVTIWKEL